MSLQEIHKNCHRLFHEGLFEKYFVEENGQEEFMGYSKACKVYDKLIEDA